MQARAAVESTEPPLEGWIAPPIMDTDALGRLGVNDGVLGTGGELVDGVPRRRIDTAPYAPKGIVIAESAAPADKPQLPPEQAIIYEAGVTQLTGHPSAARLADLLAGEPGFEGVTDIPAQYQGTYKSQFDIALTKRALAVKRGALEITAQQVASMVRRRQVTGSLGSPDDAIEWRLQYRYAIKASEQEQSAAS